MAGRKLSSAFAITPSASVRRGQEGGVVIRGTLELTLGDAKHLLRPGDSYYFASTIPHRFRNVGEVEGEIINAASPPRF